MPERNLAWDALVEATRANDVFESGRIAAALAAIRACCERDGILDEDIPHEITRRAEWYGQTWPHLTLTPTALARHWYRVTPKQSTVEKLRERFGD